jgi:hypothetical protein
MYDKPDYSKYTFKELKDVYEAVDKKKYPDNFLAIAYELQKRKLESEQLYKTAKSLYENKENNKKSCQLFQKIIDEYPGTTEAVNASIYLKSILDRQTKKDDTFENGQNLKLEFKGSAKEYFKIWVVSICLTLITFGIFSAWAKVRKKRYFLLKSHFRWYTLSVPRKTVAYTKRKNNCCNIISYVLFIK